MKRVLLLCWLYLSLLSTVHAQVELVAWSSSGCDKTADPYLLQTRISAMRVDHHELHISIAFKDNCCAKHSPGVRFTQDTLWVEACAGDCYGPRCGCNCCFTLDLIVDNISDTNFVTMFNGHHIVYSAEAYKTYEVKYELLNGDTINKTNKYGISEGWWITHYPNGQRKSENYYPVQPIPFGDASATISRYYSESGVLTSYYRQDTTQRWYDNGNLKFIETKRIDNYDVIVTSQSYYSDGSVKQSKIVRELHKENWIIDSCGSYSTEQTENFEEWYESGKRYKQLRNDTFWTWHESGAVQSFYTDFLSVEYYENGSIKSISTYWRSRYSKSHCMDYSLSKEFYPNGQQASLLFFRDELHGAGILKNRYEWKWNESGELIVEPKNWSEPLPEFPKK